MALTGDLFLLKHFDVTLDCGDRTVKNISQNNLKSKRILIKTDGDKNIAHSITSGFVATMH